MVRLKRGDTFILKVSGAIISPQNVEYISKYSEMLKRLYGMGYRFTVVVGGGPVSRNYISAGRSLGLNESLLDMLGIEVSRLNASLLIGKLYDIAYPTPPKSMSELLSAWSSGKVVVMGGLQPGQSTNAVAALAAEILNAKVLVNASRVDAVYDKDPTKYANARRLKRITIKSLKRILRRSFEEAGTYQLMDLLSLNILERSRIPLVVIDGRRPELIEEFIVKGKVVGTYVKP